MKMNILASALAAVGLVGLAAPAHADYRSHNYYHTTHKTTYSPGAYNSANYGGYGDAEVFVATPLPCLIFCPSNRPKQGEPRVFSDGKTYSYDKATNHWKLVTQGPVQQAPSQSSGYHGGVTESFVNDNGDLVTITHP